jgi:hypothetical protein
MATVLQIWAVAQGRFGELGRQPGRSAALRLVAWWIARHALEVIERIVPGGAGVKLYFDKESGLLVRQVRYSSTAVGVIRRTSSTRIIDQLPE